MNINPSDHQGRDHQNEETPAELLVDCLDLIERATDHLTPDHIEDRLRQILDPTTRPGPHRAAPDVPSHEQARFETTGALDGKTRAGSDSGVWWDRSVRSTFDPREACEGGTAAQPTDTEATNEASPARDLAVPCVEEAENASTAQQVWSGLRRRLIALESQLSTACESLDQAADPALTRPGFWRALTPRERDAFTALAKPVVFDCGQRLWRENDQAGHILMLKQGWVRASTVHRGQARLLAIRGPGDIVGERTALLLRRRSATVVALDTVHALSVSTRRFGEFLVRHPRVLNVVEAELQQRLAEDPRMVTHPAPPPSPGEQAPIPAFGATGQMSSIVFADIVRFSHENHANQLQWRADMNQTLRSAMDHAQLPWDACYREDRGDGALIIVPPQFPPGTVIDDLAAHLREALRRHNLMTPAESPRLRMRVAMHVGPVILDEDGAAGAAIIHAARLMELAELRSQMARADTDLGFITSSFVFDNVVASRSEGGVGPNDFAVARSRFKEADVTGWIHLAERPTPPILTSSRRRPRRRPTPEPYHLSVSEAELIELITRGLTDRQIALHLVVSEQDLKDRLRRIRGKLATSGSPPDAPDAPLSASALTAAYLDGRLAST